MSENIYWMLLQIAFRSKHGLMKLADKHELTVVQLHILGIMRPGKSMPMNKISCFLLCDASNITSTVDRLLARGYIIREEKPEDRRVKMLTLTEKGEVLRHRLFNDMSAYELPEFGRLTSEQRGQLQSMLSVILAPPLS